MIEEILRIQGYSHSPPAALPALTRIVPAATTWKQEESVRGPLCAWGYDEVILDSFVTDENERQEAGRDTVSVENPPSGKGVLRPSVLPNMLSLARYLPFLVPERRLFEIGRTFHRVGGWPEERRTVAWMVIPVADQRAGTPKNVAPTAIPLRPRQRQCFGGSVYTFLGNRRIWRGSLFSPEGVPDSWTSTDAWWATWGNWITLPSDSRPPARASAPRWVCPALA